MDYKLAKLDVARHCCESIISAQALQTLYLHTCLLLRRSFRKWMILPSIAFGSDANHELSLKAEYYLSD